MVKKLSAECEVIAAHMSATTAAFVVLVRCLEQNGSLERGQFPEAILEYMDLAKSRATPLVLKILDDLRLDLSH